MVFPRYHSEVKRRMKFVNNLLTNFIRLAIIEVKWYNV